MTTLVIWTLGNERFRCFNRRVFAATTTFCTLEKGVFRLYAGVEDGDSYVGSGGQAGRGTIVESLRRFQKLS